MSLWASRNAASRIPSALPYRRAAASGSAAAAFDLTVRSLCANSFITGSGSAGVPLPV